MMLDGEEWRNKLISVSKTWTQTLPMAIVTYSRIVLIIVR